MASLGPPAPSAVYPRSSHIWDLGHYLGGVATRLAANPLNDPASPPNALRHGMPKATSPVVRDTAPFKHNVNSLKRNQACHQCRKRKLKCDAKRPCSTCLRSHAYALSHAPPSERAALPQRPECTYDEVSIPAPEQAPPAPKTRYEKLESRINELESLLRAKSTTPALNTADSPIATADNNVGTSAVTSSADFGVFSITAPQPAASSSALLSSDWSGVYFDQQQQQQSTSLHGQEYAPLTSVNALESLAGLAAMMDESSNPAQAQKMSNASSPASDGNHANVSMSPPAISDASTAPTSLDDVDQGLLFLSWPANLPDPMTTRHLIQAFFSHCVHATRLFHAPTFFASLNLHPSDAHFPRPSVLHVMCAIGSLYTSAFPAGSVVENYPYDPVTRTKRKNGSRATTFSSQQARLAREAIDDDLEVGDAIFENAQARVLLTWYYYSQAKWIDSCLSSAMGMRSCVTTGINICPPFQGLSVTGGDRAPSVLPPAKSVIEDEMRRNTFWISYCLDRQLGAGNGWAMNIDDLDIHQLFPLRGDQWEHGELVLPPARQYSHSPDALRVFPDAQTDPFIMFSKTAMLMCRVKNFCLRFKSLRYSGDPSTLLPEGLRETSGPGPNSLCLRETPAFIQLDEQIQIVKSSFPPYMKHVMRDGRLDMYTYLSWNLVHLAQIHLHEPFASPGNRSCTSALSILTASRAIVDLLHTVTSTSYDVSLLDTCAFLCWYMAGRVLVRFLKAAADMQAIDQLVPLQAEVGFIRGTLYRAGERMPLAYCYWKMLQAVITDTGVDVGDEDASMVPGSPVLPLSFHFPNMKHPAPVPVSNSIPVAA